MKIIVKSLAIALFVVVVILAASFWIYREPLIDLSQVPSLSATEEQALSGLNTEKARAERAAWLRELIRVPSVRGREIEVTKILQRILKENGIESRIYAPAGLPDRASLVAELPGSEKEAGLILTAHTDVVEANAADWSEDPFAGTLKDDKIYGRGAIDMKGMLVMELQAFIEFHRSPTRLRRKLMLLAVADEESGGEHGMRFLSKEHPEIFRGYKYSLNEGGLGSKDIVVKGSRVYNVQYAEKGALWVRVTAEGEGGHASAPSLQSPTHRLESFLHDVEDQDHSLIIGAEVAVFFAQLSTIASFPNSFVLRHPRHPLSRIALGKVVRTNTFLRAMTMNTRAITSFQAGDLKAVNVLPREARSTLDVRLLPNFDPDLEFRRLERLARKHDLKVERVHSSTASSSPVTDPFFLALCKVAKDSTPGSIATPLISPMGTDNSVLRTLGIHAYGLVPGLFTQAEISSIHGVDEAISLENLDHGTQVIARLIAIMQKIELPQNLAR